METDRGRKTIYKRDFEKERKDGKRETKIDRQTKN